MAYKRYIKKDGKTYGPYFYESKKLDGKVISNYVGKGSVKKNSFSSLRKNFVFVFGFFLLSLFIVFMTTNLTGNVALSVEDSYISGENLEGVIKLSLEQGEFIPSSTLILVNNSGEIFEYYLSDLISETPEEGIYSLEGINLSGSGEGFGVEDISYPTVFFSLEIFEEAVNETIVGEVEVPETVEPEAPVEENVTEEVPETNITEEINETEITNETVVEEINETVEESEEEINESSDEIVEIVGESEVPAEELQEETSEQLVEVLVEGETTEESSVESSSDSSSESSESDSDESSSESESSDSGSESESESSSEESSDSSSESSDSGDSSSESSDSSSESSESSSDSGGSESSESGITGQIIGAMFNFFSLTGNVVSSEVELSVDYNETVRYNLSEGQSAEIKSGSVRTSEKDLEDSDVVLIQKTGYVEATTFYSEGQSKTYEINLTDLNLSAREGILSIGLSYNGTEILQEEKAILVQENETLVNQTLNETLVPINVTNVTSVNVSNVSVSVNTTQFSVVINRPVKWKKRVEVNKTDGVQNISIELPKEAMNISVYKIVDRELNGEKEVLVEEGVVVTNETFSEGIEESVIIEENVSEIEGNESVEEVNATEVLEPVPSVEIIESSEENLSETDVRIGLTGNVIVGQVSLEIDTDKEERSLIADFFKKIFSALTGRVVEITEEESVKEVIIETDETENETEIEIEYETPGPTSTEVVLNGDKRVIVNSSLHYENVLAYTVMEGGAGEDYVIYWEENKTFLPIYYQDTDGVDRYIEWVIPHLSTQTFTVQKVEETCADWINGTHNQTECSGDGIVLEKMLSMGEIKKLTASDAEDNDRFGESVSISSDGTTVIVGAYNESGTGSDIGAAYIYKNESGGWTETKLNASDAEDNDRFGESVSISSDGTTVIVGANGEDGAGSNRGAAYIYKNESGGWTETKLNASDAEDGDEFGFSVSISSDGTTVIVGAYAEDGAGDNRGAAYIYKNESGGWTETKLNASDAENSDFFGYSVSISSDGTKAIVGARWENGAGSKRGAAYIYKNESGGWTETKLTASDTGDDDNFGYSVSISSDGTTAIVGAFNEAGTGSGMGAAYIYKNESGGWTEIKKLNASDAENNDYFGISVSISSDGTTAIVGANGEDGAGSNRGAAYIYENESGGWTETKLTASDAENSDSFGSLVSISSDGTKIIIGAYNEDGAGSDRGAAYVFGEGAFGDYYSSGDYVSQVLDAGENVNWSGLEWNGTLPGSGGTTSVADNSLLFDGTDYLSWTPGSADDADNWTYSWWMKPSDVSTTNNMRILTARTASNTMEEVRIYYGEIVYFWRVSGVDKANIIWNSKLRDPSEWYHCLFTRDGTSVKFYVNGIEVTDTTVNTAVQSGTGLVNTNVAHYIGHNPDVGWEFDGYMNNANFIDGQALTPSSFGEYNSQGKWVPKEYSGTYGTNGFNLKFENASALGQDGSGNGNNWTENGFNATKHQVNDTPNDNYATLNFLSTDSGVSLSEGNLYFSVPSATYQDRGSISTFEVDSGKWYFEAKYVSGNGVDLGIVDGITWNPGVRPSGNSTYLYADGSSQSIYKNSVFIENPGSVVVGDYIGIAFDVDNGSIQYYKNGVTLGAEITGVNYNSWTPYLFVSSGGTARGSDFIFNFGATNFTYAPPEGYQALSSTNLPDLSWTDASEYFNAVTYVGTGAEQDISCGFQPDMVWIKNRNQTDSHKIFDSVRGPTKYLESDTTDADTTDANSLTAFTSDGFTLGTGANGFNDNGEYFVAWCWKESPEFGFDIVNYTGTGVAHAEEHNLGVAPEMILDKVYEGGTYDWHVYNSELGGTYDLNLNSNIAAFTATVWNNLEPNSTHFNLGTLVGVNGADKNYTAYLFTSVDGFSKIGSYTGNGNADGPFVYTGFKPKYVMVKRTDSTGSWGVNVPDYQQGDNMRYWMFADKNNSQDANSQMDFLSNGFKIRATDSWSNANTGNYIYIAFADYPLKDLDSSGSTNITMQTRTSPDNSSWSDWSNYSSGVINESVRYLQYKALLTTENTSLTPVLNWVNLSYEAIKWGITLNTPEDNNNSIDLSNAVFNCSVENYLGNNLENVSIYSNLNGTWEILVTNSSISGSSGDFVFTRDLSSDKGLSSNFLDQGFNWSCYVCDNESDCEFASENRSFSSWDLGTHNQTVVSGAGVVLDLETTQGDVVESYAATNSDNDKLMRDGSTTGRGQAFTLSSSETIGYAGFYLKKVGTPVGDMVAKIYSVSGTVGTNAAPTGSALAVSSAINASSLGTSSEVINFTFTSPYSASAGNYAVVLEYYGGDASNYISMGHDVSSPAHSGNQVYNTTSWSGASDTDTIFYLYESSTVSSGDYVSQVFDSEDTVSWDSLVWKADVPLGLVNQTQKLTALDTENNDEFGNSVSISSDGTTAIVGAYLEDGAGLNRGAAYIYKNESGTWTETKLTASDATNSSNFGYSVSISSDGTTAIVGAYWEDGAGIDRGAAYIYKNESGGWTETKLTASDAADYDRFGESVSISSDGTTVIVGAKDEDGAGTDRGAAYIYKNESGGWTETKLTASDAAYSDKFGYSVSISSDGTTVIVGAKDEDGAGDTRGAAYIYKNESGGWTETKLTASDAEDWDYFGYSVSISSDGTTAIVGAYAEDGAGSARGAAYIYKNESGGWTETKLTASDATNSDYFGNSVSISSDGTTAIVGAYYEDGAGTDRGAAYIYKNESGGWIETKLNASDAADSDWFGYSVSISSDGTMVLVGASHENGAGSNRGAAYIFNGQTSLGFQTRTSSDNSSWSDWSSYSSGVVNSSTRYLQYKALLTTENTSLTPVLNWVNLSYSILVIPVADQFAIKNSIGNNVAIFDSEGNLFLKGTLSQSQSSLSAPANSFIINNNTGQTVAYVSSTGSMFLKGILSESQTSMSPGSSLQIRNSTDSIVAYIDKDGNLNLKGGAYENSANI